MSDNTTTVVLDTSEGEITLELFADKAPQTVENFLAYARSDFYDETVFHRVIPGFMVQGGGLTRELSPKQTRPPIDNEADNGLKNETASVAMARTSEPHSATAQFFINLDDNKFLNHTGQTPRGWGYAVFGKVVDGMPVVRAIEQIPTSAQGPHQNVPRTTVTIQDVRIE